jgi:hypothetical protein
MTKMQTGINNPALKGRGITPPPRINQPRRKQRGMVVLNKELQPGFNTFLTAPRGGVLNPSTRINFFITAPFNFIM